MKKNWKYIILLIFIQNITQNIFAQWYKVENVSKKIIQIYEKAYEQAQNNNYSESYKLLNECVEKDSKYVDAYLSKASLLYEEKKYSEAADWYKKGITLDTIYGNSFLNSLAQALYASGNYSEAITILDKIPLSLQTKNNVVEKRVRYLFAWQQNKNWTTEKPINLGQQINSLNMEYFPSFTVAGETIIFNRKIKSNEDFYFSQKINNQWQEAQPLKGNLNTPQNEGAQQVSLDGNTLIFTACGYENSQGSCDLYISEKTNTDFNLIKPLSINVNTEAWESNPCFSPDKQTIYYSSNRQGGYGGKDIWKTNFVNGSWQKPENLGPIINSTGDETCPFIHADNQTLYYNSTGKYGLGKGDIFKSELINDNLWSAPENLGFPINTIDEEGSFIVNTKGDKGYFASDRFGGYGSLDLYEINLPKKLQPIKSKWISVLIIDSISKKSLASNVSLVNIKNNKKIINVQTELDGKFLITIPENNKYALDIVSKGYLFYSDLIDLTNSSNNINMNIIGDSAFITIKLIPLKLGSNTILKNIFYDNKKFELKETSFIELDNLALLLLENPNIQIQINGHTDNVGSSKENIILSQKRAQAVVDYLIKKTIPLKQLKAKGFGYSKPIANNLTEIGRSKNRRTELTILSL